MLVGYLVCVESKGVILFCFKQKSQFSFKFMIGSSQSGMMINFDRNVA